MAGRDTGGPGVIVGTGFGCFTHGARRGPPLRRRRRTLDLLRALRELFRRRREGEQELRLATQCQTALEWERLAVGIATRPDQINEPLGLDRANRLAGLLGRPVHRRGGLPVA